MNYVSNKKTLIAISFCELIERFNYFGLFAVLILKLHAVFHLTDDASFIIFGLFVSISYAMLLISGYVADQFIGLKNAIILGGILLVVGNLLLAVDQITPFEVGLAIVTFGASLFKINCTSLVGTLFEENKKESGYTFFYCAMNLGSLLGPIVYGYIVTYWNWDICFIISAILMIIAICVFISVKHLSHFIPPIKPQPSKSILMIFVILLLGCLLFIFPKTSNKLMIIIYIGLILLLLRYILKNHSSLKFRLLGLLLISFFSVFFFMFSLQAASSITLFLQRDIYRGDIPTSAFTSLYPLFVILFAPVAAFVWRQLSKIKKEPTTVTKISIGILFAFIGFIAFSISAFYSAHSNELALIFLVLGYACLGAGEISFAPAVLATISKYAPEKAKSTMMGSWFLFVSFSGYMSGRIATLTDGASKAADKSASLAIYHHVFFEIALFAIATSVLVFVFRSFVSKLLRA